MIELIYNKTTMIVKLKTCHPHQMMKVEMVGVMCQCSLSFEMLYSIDSEAEM